MKVRALLFCVFLSLSVSHAQQGNTQTVAPEVGREAEGTQSDCVMFTKRLSDVVLIPGRRLEGLLGEPIPGIRLMVWNGDRWEPVPFQVDEKEEDGDFLFPFGGENDQEKLDHKLAPWDEAVFMARDAGYRAVPLDGPPGHTKVEEIEVTDPLSGEKGWFYLCSFLEPPPLSPVDLIEYDPDYDRFKSRHYVVGYSRVKHDQKAVMEYYSVPPESGGTGVNWFDSAKIWTRIKLFFSLFQITIHSDDWDSWVPAYIDGPIRVIVKKRMHIRIGLGLHTPAVDADLVYYPHFFISAVVIGIPFDPSIVTSTLKISIGTDLNHHAMGMLFWNSENPDPVIVDGRMSPQELAMDMSPDTWRVVSGEQGKYMGKAVYGGNFKLSKIKLDEGRYIDDYRHKEPPENEDGIFGSYNWTWDITKGKKGKYVVWMEAHYGRPIESEEDLKCCLDVTDHPLLVRIGPEEKLNCLLISPPGFGEDVLPGVFRKTVFIAEEDESSMEPEVGPETSRQKRGKGHGKQGQR
jgi:hypothetical protein